MLGEIFVFSIKNGIFLTQNVFIADFLVQIRNQRLKIEPCAKFEPDWTKDKGAWISTSNDTENCLMTSYLPHSDEVSKIFMALERFCLRVISCQV